MVLVRGVRVWVWGLREMRWRIEEFWIRRSWRVEWVGVPIWPISWQWGIGWVSCSSFFVYFFNNAIKVWESAGINYSAGYFCDNY